MPNRILVPVDLKNTDKLGKALDLAARMARDHDATLVYAGVVYAVPTASAVTSSQQMEADLHSFAEGQAEAHGVKTADHVALRGDFDLSAGPGLIQAAKDTDCDMIVMASHVPGVADHILSSNAGYVASHAPMSVMVVR